MSTSMTLRSLYLPADVSGIDRERAAHTIRQLCRGATLDDLRLLQRRHDTVSAVEPGTDVHAAAMQMRDSAERHLLDHLDVVAASLHGRDVARQLLSADHNGPAVVAYHTGGPAGSDEGPTDAYDAWDLIFDTDQLPLGWSDAIGAAAGLLHPSGTGPRVTAVTLHSWA